MSKKMLLRKRILSLVLLLLCAQASFAQLNVWRWQNPLPEGNLLLAVKMISLDVIYACGENSSFIRTSDAGQTWDIRNNILGSNKSFNALSFIDRNYGMCGGDSGKVIKTTDGGSTWQLLATKTTFKINSIVVVDKNTALIVVLNGGILKTTDGGNTWFAIPFEGTLALYSIRMLRPDFLTITGYGGTVLRSVDTGRTWQTIKTPYGNTYFGARFTDDNTATIVGDAGLILRTDDGGNSWTQQRLADSSIITAPLNMIDGEDPNILAIAGDDGTILYSVNGGSRWDQSDIGTREHIKGLSFFDTLNATAVGHDGVVLRTTNGGKDWFFLPHIPFTDILYSIAFQKGDTSLGLTCGYSGTILRTTNGGRLWGAVSSGTGNTLRGICFMDSMNVITVGDYGTILMSADAGLTWNPVSSGTSKHLFAVNFATPNDGLVVGDHGIVLRTYLAGQFWTTEYPGSGAAKDFLRSVSFPDRNHAFMSGQGGYYTSKDGGVNWIYAPIVPSDTVDYSGIALSFADSVHGGLLFGDGNQHLYLVKVTVDGGASWSSPQALPTTPFGIQFVDPLHATIVGKGGYIMHASDGKTFLQQQSNTLNSLIAVCFGKAQAGTAVGYRGNIMHITTNEKLESVAEQGALGIPKIIIDGNYPNPFSESTTIRYHLPSSGFTTIEIFSIEGKPMAAFDTEFESSGEHEVRFDAANLRSGTYICRVSCNGISTEEKLTIDK